MRLLYFKSIKIENWRKAVIYGVSVWAFLLLEMTEGLSVVGMLNTEGVAIAWVLIVIALVVASLQKNNVKTLVRVGGGTKAISRATI
jgi:hypothetical protein